MSDKRRSMDYPPVYGLDCPSWGGPDCFYYATEDEARAAIARTYGPSAPHVVVRMEVVR